MTVVSFDSKYFDNNISPKIKIVKDKLLKANKKVKELNVPVNFKYYKYLIGIDDTINDYIKDIEKFNNWVSDCKKEYKSLSDKYEKRLDDVSNYSISKHNKI